MAAWESYEANKDLLFVDYADQDRAMVGVIQALTQGMERDPGNAKQYLSVIKEISTQERTGADGTKLGTMLDSASLGPDVAKLLASADAEFGRIRDRDTTYQKQDFWMQAESGNLDQDKLKEFFDNPDNRGAMTEAERRGLEAQHFRARQAKSEQLTKASLKAQAEQAKKTFFDDALTVGDRKELAWLTDSTYFDENGNEKTVTVQQKRDAAISAMMEREQRWLQTAPGKPEEKAETSFNRIVEWLSENGAKHPQWERCATGPN